LSALPCKQQNSSNTPSQRWALYRWGLALW